MSPQELHDRTYKIVVGHLDEMLAAFLDGVKANENPRDPQNDFWKKWWFLCGDSTFSEGATAFVEWTKLKLPKEPIP